MAPPRNNKTRETSFPSELNAARKRAIIFLRAAYRSFARLEFLLISRACNSARHTLLREEGYLRPS